MKKIIVSVLCVVLIFIPTFIAIASYITTQNNPISNSFAEKIDISDLDGNTYTIAKTKKEGDLVSFFSSMNSNSVKVAELPEPLVGTAFYKVVFYTGNVAEEYKYYFNTSGLISYSEYPDGSVHQLDPADVNKFLATPYSLSLFPDEELPLLKTSTSDIVPSKVNWNYKLNGENFSAISGFKTTEELLTYDMEGGIDLLFTSDADLYVIKVYDKDSNLVFDATTEDMSTVSFETVPEMTFMITASWYEDNTRNYYGEATYNFKTNLTAGTEFFIGESTIDPGEFVAITAYNVSDPSKISFSSSPDIGFTPTFYLDGDCAVGLVPIDVNLEHKSYVFTLSYGSVSQDINLAISNKTFKKRTQTVSDLILKNTRSEEALKEFDEKFNEICATSETEKYYEGNFIDYESKDSIAATIKAGFGLYRTINKTNITYRNPGVQHQAAAGTGIPASNTGKVVYTGITAHRGRMVVIDHGFGLKTWYMHLGEIKTEVGAIVSKGDIIGTAGNSGFAEMNGVYTMMTVGNIPVCPYSTWENSIIMYRK